MTNYSDMDGQDAESLLKSIFQQLEVISDQLQPAPLYGIWVNDSWVVDRDGVPVYGPYGVMKVRCDDFKRPGTLNSQLKTAEVRKLPQPETEE